jgi:hypothetical protein
MNYTRELPDWEPRPNEEIISTWFADFIAHQNHEPFKHHMQYNRYINERHLKIEYQFAFMGLLLLWELVKAVRGLAHDHAWRIGYEMMRDRDG